MIFKKPESIKEKPASSTKLDGQYDAQALLVEQSTNEQNVNQRTNMVAGECQEPYKSELGVESQPSIRTEATRQTS